MSKKENDQKQVAVKEGGVKGPHTPDQGPFCIRVVSLWVSV